MTERLQTEGLEHEMSGVLSGEENAAGGVSLPEAGDMLSPHFQNSGIELQADVTTMLTLREVVNNAKNGLGGMVITSPNQVKLPQVHESFVQTGGIIQVDNAGNVNRQNPSKRPGMQV